MGDGLKTIPQEPLGKGAKDYRTAELMSSMTYVPTSSFQKAVCRELGEPETRYRIDTLWLRNNNSSEPESLAL